MKTINVYERGWVRLKLNKFALSLDFPSSFRSMIYKQNVVRDDNDDVCGSYHDLRFKGRERKGN